MTETSQKTSPAVVAAKENRNKPKAGSVQTLSTGVRIKVNTVPPGLVEDVMAQVKEPPVPMFYDEERDREYPNPTDPEYIKALQQVERDRSVAMIEAIVLFGIELVDGLPDDETWLKKLRFMGRRGTFDISGYDLDDELDREFLFKRYICLGTADDLALLVSSVQGIEPQDIDKARQTFLDDTNGEAD